MTQVTKIILLSISMHLIKGRTEMSTCGHLGPTVEPLITNSNETHHWPWNAAIFHKYDTTSEPIFQCGGTVISSKFILTAAHCVCISNMKLDTTNISISLGRLNLGLTNENTGQSFEAADIIIHPEYNSIDYINDIAIIKLSADAKFNNFVQPCCLWSPDKVDISEVIGKLGTVVGWGLTEKDQLSKVLRKATLPVISWGTCLRSNPDVFGRLLSESSFCAGLRNGTSVCQGDSGGSMTFEENGIYYIRGIVSISPSKTNRKTQASTCDSSQYAVFTDVARFLSWIRVKALIECVTKVRCEYSFGDKCMLEVNRSNQNCKFTFDKVLNPAVVTLSSRYHWGFEGFEVIPDLSDAVSKFENLKELCLNLAKLKIVERSKLTAFGRHLKILNLSFNEISQLDADTFDDLKNLRELHLQENVLKVVHRDLFKELANLKLIVLATNQLEIIPEGLFRNNNKLETIHLEENQLKKIEIDFCNMPNIFKVMLTSNVCIDDYCYYVSRDDCSDFNELIRSNCTN